MVEREHRQQTSWMRLLAPVAFFAAATVLILIVHNSLQAQPQEPAETSATATATARTAETGTGQATTGPARKKKFYRVKEGDTLESIAARHDTTVEELLELNPDIDPLALSPGQRIRVR